MSEITSAQPRDLSLVSVIVCTRNRPTHIPRAVASILQSDYPHFELLIVDESNDNATADALAPLLQATTSRTAYHRLRAKGMAKALNYALPHARGQYLAFTDDDCEMAPDCLSNLLAAFEADITLGVVFGDVAAAPHDTAQEHIPKWRVHQPNTIDRPADFIRMSPHRGASWLNFGIGANMAIRSAALRTIEGFDPCIGPGEKFGSGDDHDVAFRLLRAAYRVHFCPGARVVHHGARPLTGMQLDSRRVGRGFGAAFAKHLKCGTLYRGSARTVPFHLARLCAGSLNGKRSDSAGFLLGWVSGFCGGLVCAVNGRTHQFQGE